MAIEARRGCGYRKVGGLYLVAPGGGMDCDRLPMLLEICPCCGSGFKQARGWTWIDVVKLTGGPHDPCQDQHAICPLCSYPSVIGRAGLLWVGERFYPTTKAFSEEADALGISKRISVVPEGFVIGHTWVLLAHPKAYICPTCHGSCFLPQAPGSDTDVTCSRCSGKGELAGIFRVFRPTAIEKIVTQSESKLDYEMKRLKLRGITPVVVPDDDKDHQGSVYE